MAIQQSDKRWTVRSFVRRAGRLTTAQRRALRELWPRYGLECSDTPLDLDSLFGRRAPRVLEIGFGNGETLVGEAARDPATDFIGVEVHEPGIGRCLLQADAAGLTNLRLISADAIDVMRSGIPDASLSRVNLYFPDPWPKKRHHKRRILRPEFLEVASRIIAPGGTLHIATDWEDYALAIDRLLQSAGDFKLTDRCRHKGDAPVERETTKFERRGLRLGHSIWDWRLERI